MILYIQQHPLSQFTNTPICPLIPLVPLYHNSFIMGNSIVNPSRNYDVLGPGWELTSKGKLSSTWTNTMTGEQIQQYLISTQDAKDYLRHKQVYNFRFQSGCLVASKHFKELPSHAYCTTIYRANLYLEKIVNRLDDFQCVEESRILSLYSQCFRGFQSLFEKIGSFDISQRMICFNQKGVIKVWVNEKLTATEKMRPHYGSSLKGETEMIRRIVELVSRRSGPYHYIGSYILNKNPQSLQKALEIVQNLERVYPRSVPGQQELARGPLMRSLDWGFFKSKSKLLSQSYQGSHSSPNSLVGQVNHSYIQNEYLGVSGNIPHNNINMSIPVSSVKQINQASFIRPAQTVLGAGREIRGNPVRLQAANSSIQQQRPIGVNPSTISNTGIPANGVRTARTSEKSYQTGGVTGVVYGNQSRGEQRVVGSTIGNVGPRIVHQGRTVDHSVSRLGGISGRRVSTSPIQITRNSPIVSTHRVGPIQGQTVSSLGSNNIFASSRGQTQGTVSWVNRTNPSEIVQNTQQRFTVPAPGERIVAAPIVVQDVQNPGALTQFYRQEGPSSVVVDNEAYEDGGLRIADTGVEEELPDNLIGVLRGQSEAFEEHIKSEVDLKEKVVNHIEGESVGANGIQFIATSAPVNVQQPQFVQQVIQGVPLQHQQIHQGQIHRNVPIHHPISSSRLHNAFQRIHHGNVQVLNGPQRVTTHIHPHQIHHHQPQVVQEIRIANETNQIPATVNENPTVALDQNVGINNQYTSSEIRKLAARAPVTVVRPSNEPVFLPDQRPSNESPIQRANVREPINVGASQFNGNQTVVESTTTFQNNPYFNNQGGLHIPSTPQSHVQGPQVVNSNVQQKVHQTQHLPQYSPVNQQHSQHVRHPQAHVQQIHHQNQGRVINPQHQVPAGIHHIPQPHPHFQHQQQQHLHPQHQHHHQQQHQHQQHIHNIDPRFQQFPQQQVGVIQPYGVPAGFGLPMVPPEMLGMMNMMGAMGPDGAVIVEMVDIAPTMEIVVDEHGNEFVEVDVGGMLPMMMGMGMGIPMGVGMVGMPMGIQVPIGMMGVAPMVIVQDLDIDIEDLSPEMMMEMMEGAAPTRVVRGPTGRLVEVEVPQEPLIPESFPASSAYSHPYQQIPGQIPVQQIPQRFQGQPFVQPPHHYPHPQQQQQQQNIPYGGSIYQQQSHPSNIAHSQASRQQELRREELAKEQAEQARLYADYQAKVQNLLNKRQELIEEEERKLQEQEQLELEGLRVETHHLQAPEIRETIQTTIIVDQGYGNITETITTEEIVIDREGGGSYNYEEEKIEITPQHHYQEQQYIVNNQKGVYEQVHVHEPSTPIQEVSQQTRIYEPYNRQRADSSNSRGSRGSHSKLNQGTISQPLTFGSSKGIKSNTNININSSTQIETQEAANPIPSNYEYQGYANTPEEVSSSQNHQYYSAHTQPEYNFISSQSQPQDIRGIY